MEEYYVCSRCGEKVGFNFMDVCIFKSAHKHHTLLSIQMCLECRDKVFDFIEGKDVDKAYCEKCRSEKDWDDMYDEEMCQSCLENMMDDPRGEGDR